eukprot:CAMPEP_0172736946 /NCGR_PEP_ID=MMETSP1074-20121228/116422_1 /TAXON_ID=2916 /ORGANISM="Ceratium fusus, Strain PA161109" /LENGTH=46 /DNA_ID= /DNA_START= /DNA_END= /DNA_ORIENTATION=
MTPRPSAGPDGALRALASTDLCVDPKAWFDSTLPEAAAPAQADVVC